MYDYGTTPAQVAAVRAAHSAHASNNPEALYKNRVTVDDVLASRIICEVEILANGFRDAMKAIRG